MWNWKDPNEVTRCSQFAAVACTKTAAAAAAMAQKDKYDEMIFIIRIINILLSSSPPKPQSTTI